MLDVIDLTEEDAGEAVVAVSAVTLKEVEVPTLKEVTLPLAAYPKPVDISSLLEEKQNELVGVDS